MSETETRVSANPSQTPSWLLPAPPNPRARLRLFCFPYAGGGAHIYRSWQAQLPSTVELCAVQLPGHGHRIRETAFNRMDSLVEAAAVSLLPHCDKPFAFFGHSMGALISFELARMFRKKYGVQPLHLFVSGHRAPQIKDPNESVHNLPDKELVEKLNGLNGTPREVLEHPELMQVVLPILRADFAICETYQYTNEPPLTSPIFAFGGTEDEEAGPEQLEGWRAQTVDNFSLQMVPGDHFFLHTAQTRLLAIMSPRLTELVGQLV